MCSLENNFRLCTCKPKTSAGSKRRKSKRNKSKVSYLWRLYLYLGQKATLLEGMTKLPSNSLQGGLAANYVLSKLNSQPCFDFEYLPREGDFLVFETQNSRWSDRFLGFIFQRGQWVQGHYDSFQSRLDLIAAGNVDYQKEDGV